MIHIAGMHDGEEMDLCLHDIEVDQKMVKMAVSVIGIDNIIDVGIAGGLTGIETALKGLGQWGRLMGSAQV